MGLAVGVVALLVGLVVNWWIVVAGAAIAVAFALLWVRDLARPRRLTEVPELEPERRDGRRRDGAPLPPRTYGRSAFLELSTLGLGGVIGGLVTLPALGFMTLPAFLKQRSGARDIGPLSDYPVGKFVVATFMARPEEGEVSRRTAFVRNNGAVDGRPSFTIISNHCAHLGCPVQPNTDVNVPHKQYRDVTLIPLPSPPSGFGCPCHGGQYDTEGNRIAGPPVRALDRYGFSVRGGHLFLEAPFSVSHVEGEGATARIHKYTFAFPGEHIDGPESWLYPIQPPH
ncbi:MAG TPA: Rieske 2Fe-2S domain-containing protein [Gaiellaceae bacterium]|nr:Rieske 2Fe-2S domain-containing protein [Gaiellaceae bacterium]